jgi:trehalose 6-phosphate synthase
VAQADRVALQVEAASALEGWLQQHPGFAITDGADALEVGPIQVRKAVAIPWLRRRLGPGARLIILGDDIGDEEIFAAINPTDEAIIVGDAPMRPTRANWRLSNPEDVAAFLGWIRAVREEAETPSPPLLPAPIRLPPETTRPAGSTELLVVSNRLPELRTPVTPEESQRRNVGGLVSALAPIMRERSGLWLGWSGHISQEDGLGPVGMDDSGRPVMAWLDFSRRWAEDYYSGFCNRALWPLFHTFPANVTFDDEHWRSYIEVNEAFATVSSQLASADAAVWAHDYHLYLLGRGLRRRGHRGPIGHFLHIPFPAPDLFWMLPWAEELLDAMLDFDLLGFQTPAHVENFRQVAGDWAPARVSDDAVEHRARRTRIGAFPIGISVEDCQPQAEQDPQIAALLSSIAPARLILGVDRLDYTKGIPARLRGFGRLLEIAPELRGKISLVQISVPSRGDIPEYSEQRAQVESVVGRINGEYGEGNWIPVRYLYRSFDRGQLAQLYRSAEVGLVTPLRDGMNLVAKEFVAAQDPDKPGVLVLSRFAGAAAELQDAVLTNPYHLDALARDLRTALAMPEGERKTRHGRLLAAVTRKNAQAWAEDFLRALLACRSADVLIPGSQS